MSSFLFASGQSLLSSPSFPTERGSPRLSTALPVSLLEERPHCHVSEYRSRMHLWLHIVFIRKMAAMAVALLWHESSRPGLRTARSSQMDGNPRRRHRAGDIVLNWLSGQSLCLCSIGCMCRGPLALSEHSSRLDMAGRRCTSAP